MMIYLIKIKKIILYIRKKFNNELNKEKYFFLEKNFFFTQKYKKI